MTEPFSERLPDADQAERAVLGCVLIENKCFFRIDSIVDVEDFRTDAHQAIYKHVAAILRAGKELDLLTLKASFSKRELEELGGPLYISGLVDGIPYTGIVERYADEVAKAARRRRLAVEGHRITAQALAGEESPTDIAQQAVQTLSLISVQSDRQAMPIFEIVTAEHERRDRRTNPNTDRLLTGMTELDNRHVIRPTFIVAGAPHGHGKSAFLINIAERINRMNDDAAVLIVTLEMTGSEISDRIIAVRSGVAHRDIRAWSYLSEAQRAKIASAREHLRGRKLFVTRRLRELSEIIAEAHRLKMTRGLRAVCIDYIQLIAVRGIREKEQQMAHAAAQLLELAVDQEIAVIVASQLNKDRHDRSSKRIWMQDLKYASAIGDSARVGLLFQRPREDNKDAVDVLPCKTLFQIEKNNEGTTGDYEIHFDPVLQRFGEGDCGQNDCRVNRAANDQRTMLH